MMGVVRQSCAAMPRGFRKPSRRLALCVLLFAAVSACTSAADAPAPLTVFAAASLTDVLGELAQTYEAETGQVVRLSFAASGAVARQVEAGAPADLVVLADAKWMDRLSGADSIQPDSRVSLLGNRLVVVARPDTVIGGEPLTWLGRSGGKLVIGDPDSVPAGAYAREWLQGRGLWDGLQSSLVTAADVRAVRGFVARGEAQLGVVYRSDATGFDAVRIVEQPPAADQPDIVYPAALTTGARPEATAFLRHLRTPQASAVFRRYGFEPL